MSSRFSRSRYFPRRHGSSLTKPIYESNIELQLKWTGEIIEEPYTLSRFGVLNNVRQIFADGHFV